MPIINNKRGKIETPESKELKNKLQELEKELDRVQGEYDKMYKDYWDLHAEFKEKAREDGRLVSWGCNDSFKYTSEEKSILDKLWGEKNKKEIELDKVKKEYEDLKNKIKEVEFSAYDKQENGFEPSDRAKYDELAKSVKEAKKRIDNDNNQIDRINNEISNLKNQLSALTQLRNKHEKDYNKLVNELEKFEEEFEKGLVYKETGFSDDKVSDNILNSMIN